MKKIESVAEFLEWCREIGGGSMLYRGLASARWKVEASLYRRLLQKGVSASKARSFFIHASEDLVEQAKQHGHARDSAGELKDLQVMARLQHYGASTCLIDFTRNPLVALWFACEPPKKKGQRADGKVVAINSDDFEKYKIIQSKHLDDSLGDLLKKDHLWKWQPEKLNNRIVAQHSEFIFGKPVIAPDKERVISAAARKDIFRELKEYNISEEHLLADFYGFAQLNAHSRPYNYAPLAAKAAEDGDNQRAVHLYDIAIKKNQDNPTLLNNRGSVKADANNFLGAIADFDAAIRLNKKYAKAYFNRGKAKGELENHQGAIADYDQAIILTSQDAAAYFSRAYAKGELDNYKGAMVDYSRVIELNPQDADAYHNRGFAKDELGDYKGAIADYGRAIKISRQDAVAYYNRAIAKDKLGDYKGAIADYGRAIKISRQDAAAYYNRAIVKRKSGDEKGAAADFRKAEELEKPKKK